MQQLLKKCAHSLNYLAIFWCKKQGRWAAMLLVCAFSVLLVFPVVPSLQALQHRMFDIYQTSLPRQSVKNPVWIVEIDEASLATIGQWPWPRNYLSALVDSINALHPAAIGLDIIMPEPDHASPHALAESRTDLPNETLDALRHAVSNDHLLADSLAQSPSVLGVAGLDYSTPLTQKSLTIPAIALTDSTLHHSLRPSLHTYSDLLTSLPELQKSAHGQGLLSAHLERGVLRKATIFASVNQTSIPNFSLEIMRVAKRAPQINLDVGSLGVKAVRVGDLKIPLQSNGESWLYFDRLNRSRYISALKVFNGEVPAQQFENQIVIIGLTGLGLQDMMTTPHGDRRPGVESHVQFIEAALNHQTIQRPVWMPTLELVLFWIITTSLIYYVPSGKFIPRHVIEACQLLFKRFKKAPLDSKEKPNSSLKPSHTNKPVQTSTFYVHPSHVIWLMLLFTLLLFGLGFILFARQSLLFDAANIWLGLAVVLLSLYISSHMLEASERRLTEKALFEQRLQAAKVNGEMEAASKIQLGTLPDADSTFSSDEKRFEIAAFLEPVKHVGGDLYDFFMRDESHLFFVIGDVSGKGLPASLLMVVTKALMKNAVLRDAEAGHSSSEALISQIVSIVNTEMTRENPQMLFVTGVAGLLNLDTGELAFVNAGHDAPWLIHADGTVARVEGEGNPPLGVMDEFEFSATTYKMQSGEALFMVTDGVTEAMDIQQVFYTVERVTSTLVSLALPMPAKPLLESMKGELRDFVGEADAADDITMLSIRWLGL